MFKKLLIGLPVLGAILFSSYVAGYQLFSYPKETQVLGETVSNPSPTIIPSTQPSKSPVPKSANNSFNAPKTAVVQAKVVVDSDPVVNCQYQHLGIQAVKKSYCSSHVECYYQNQYHLLTNDECKQALDLIAKTQNLQDLSKSLNQMTNSWQSITPPPNFAPDNTAYNACMNNATTNFNTCVQVCRQAQQEKSQSGEYNQKEYNDCYFACEQSHGKDRAICN